MVGDGGVGRGRVSDYRSIEERDRMRGASRASGFVRRTDETIRTYRYRNNSVQLINHTKLE